MWTEYNLLHKEIRDQLQWYRYTEMNPKIEYLAFKDKDPVNN